jgi:hypothetical protein
VRSFEAASKIFLFFVVSLFSSILHLDSFGS